MSDIYTQEDIDEYRELTRGATGPVFYDVSDFTDDMIVSLSAFHWWLFSKRLRELGREILKVLHIPELVDWLERKLTRENRR